jgi:hypothetical protein
MEPKERRKVKINQYRCSWRFFSKIRTDLRGIHYLCEKDRQLLGNAGYGVPKDHFLPKNKRRRFSRVDLDEFEARIREETKAEVVGLYAKVDNCMNPSSQSRGGV